MAILQAEDIADVVKTTQRNLGKLKFTEIATTLQEHVAMKQLLRKSKVEFQSGYGVQWNVMTTTSGATKDTGLYGEDALNVGDVMQTASVDWKHVTTNYAIERREIAMNREPQRIVELVKVRRTDAMIDLADHMETKWWSRPSDTTGSGIYGVPYWIVYNATQGFTGGNVASGFTSGPGGLSATTYTTWKNYSDNYDVVSSDDLVAKWRRAAVFTNFMSATPVNDYNTGNQYGYYTNYSVIGELESLLEAQNMNLGNDIASKDGKLMFRGTPVTWVPHLEGRTGTPVYGINWGVFKPVFLRGEYLREQGPTIADGHHTVFQTHIDLTMNIRCTDRRRCFVLATADPDTIVG